MEQFKKKIILSTLLIGMPLLVGPAVYAAKPVNLSHQKTSVLRSVASGASLTANKGAGLVELSRSVDFNKTLHVRVQQTYAGYEVWGADAVVHIPHGEGIVSEKSLTHTLDAATARNSKMNGTIYDNLSADLTVKPAGFASEAGSQQIINHAVSNWQRQIGVAAPVSDQQAKRIVFMDQNNKAHWAYIVSFSAEPVKDGGLPTKQNLIIDANTMKVFAKWDDIKTGKAVYGGGFGGNVKMGKISYDGLEGDDHNSRLHVTLKKKDKLCEMRNDEVQVEDYRSRDVMSFDCKAKDPEHNNVYWNGDVDAVNEGYSPMNDALFAGSVIKDMYEKWYGVPVLTRDGEPMLLRMVVHARMDNAYWDGSKMTFGDGISMFYPLTSLGVAAHEVSHGFTQQHSNLAYYAQSGGMNEAYSDMAAQAAEYFAYNGQNSWQIGPEIFKRGDRALRYMDKPSKDCGSKNPGSWCSIDDADQYYAGLDVHYSSGVYNRAFYEMGTADGWNARKAFDVMVHANQNYWTKTSTFEQGACGVLSAAKDLGYELDAVKDAFATVKVDTSSCEL